MGTIWQDIRYGWRMLAKTPVPTLICVLTLALGIGANSAIFSIVYDTLLRSLPFPHSEQLVMIWEVDPSTGLTRGAASGAEFLDWREQNHVFSHISAWRGWIYTLTGQGGPDQVLGAQVSADFFRMLGVTPVRGRDFSADEETPGKEQVVILSYGLWQRRYGGDQSLIGRSIVINNQPYTVIGILPPDFSLSGRSRQSDVWMPLALTRTQLNRDDHSVVVFARLKEGISNLKAQTEMTSILQRLQQEYPQNDQGISLRVAPMQQESMRDMRAALLLVAGAVGFVLLIACVNVANVLLSKAAAREREIAMRLTLGASRLRIFGQLLTESTLLGIIGGALGLIVAYGALRMLPLIMPPQGGVSELPRMDQIGLDPVVVLFTAAISIGAGILFGLAPALQICRGNVIETLKEGSRSTTATRRTRFVSSLLVASEVGLSLFLLVGAGLLVRSFGRLMSEDVGFRPQNLLTMQVWLPESSYPDGRPIVNFYQQALDRVRAVPGVEAASAANFLPMSGWYDFDELDIEGRPAPPPGKPLISQYVVVDSAYARTIGLSLKRGRDFSLGDGPESPGVALINESLARQYWPNEDAIGKRIRVHLPGVDSPWRPKPSDTWLTIVGIVGDTRDWSWNQRVAGQVYLLNSQNPSRIMRIVMRTSANPTSIAAAVRQALSEVDPNQPVTDVETMNELVQAAVARRRLSMLLLAIFAAIATILAAIGIYGVMSYSVTQRHNEIGVRMALGAGPDSLIRMIVKQGMLLVLAGVAVGFVASALSVRVIRSLLYGVSAFDPLTFAAVAVLLIAVSFVSCYFPARRATRIDPAVALRSE